LSGCLDDLLVGCAAASDREFGMTIVDGSDGAATATIDVFGYLFDS